MTPTRGCASFCTAQVTLKCHALQVVPDQEMEPIQLRVLAGPNRRC